MNDNYSELDLLALMPCPLKIPLEKVISDKIKEIQKKYDVSLNYSLVSNAVMQEDVFNILAEKKSIDELPNIMLAPGIGHFFHTDFKEKFRDKGYFESIGDEIASAEFKSLGIRDPQGYYEILGFNPLVFLVDKTNYCDLPEPKCWSDLLNPCYKEKISYRGKDNRSFCEMVLLPIYMDFGEKGIEKLADSVKSRLHPSEMVKLAGTKRENAPFISVIPLSFSKMVKTSENVKIIWPEDGAAINPLIMLVKKDCSKAVRELAEFMISQEIAEIYEKIGFYTLRSDDIKANCNYKWCGWNFIKDNSMHNLLTDLNEIMFKVINSKKGL